MDSILVKGGNKLNGIISISGAKNAALPIMNAALLSSEKIILKNIPRLVDINTMTELLTNHGAKYEWLGQNEISIDASDITSKKAPYDIVKKMRASFWVLGPLLARFGYAEVSMPGGCAIGARMVDQHIAVMEALGAKVKVKNGYVLAKTAGRLKACHYNFTKISVGATINGLMAATLADGETILTNCACEPEIADLCNFLVKMGAKIKGIGTTKLIITGVENLSGTTHSIIGDRIEAGTYMAAVGITGGKLVLNGIDYSHIENIILQLKQSGINFKKITEDKIEVEANSAVKSVDVQTSPYPGFATDLQAQYMALMAFAKGTSVISENIFENRFMHVPELIRMGANITIDGHTAIVRGEENLYGAEVMASDLRASSSLILAGLGADGETKVRRIYHLDRGYENIVEKLRNCGAEISRIKGDNL
jgi:UDP-N-acetylglucosamine 1-carboxyvinyltransferase